MNRIIGSFSTRAVASVIRLCLAGIWRFSTPYIARGISSLPASLRSRRAVKIEFYLVILFASLTAPFLFGSYVSQITVLWVMVLFAVTWDSMGGQMGYNSLGNVFFFGAGMYISAVVQIGLHYDVAEYTSAYGAIKVEFTRDQYLYGIMLGTLAAGIGSVVLAALLSLVVFGLRGPYFAIGTLGIALAAGELVSAWELVGAGSGISLPVFPEDFTLGEYFWPGAEATSDNTAWHVALLNNIGISELFFYFSFFGMAVAAFFFFRWLYGTRFGLAINAIRDDEEKAEAMGIRTMRYKTITWSFSAFFLGLCGSIYGNYSIFIEPIELAFATVTFGIPMVVMALLGGKGTLWGPVIGAVLYHIIKEATWTYLLGWQWVALGMLIVITVVFFQQGIMGWAHDKWPEFFGIEVEDAPADTTEGAA